MTDWTLVKKTHKYKKFDLNLPQFQEIDPISENIYYIIREYSNQGKGLPASFITKELNKRLYTNYTKKEIGDILYEGKLSKYFIKDTSNMPTLWNLPRRIKINSQK